MVVLACWYITIKFDCMLVEFADKQIWYKIHKTMGQGIQVLCRYH